MGAGVIEAEGMLWLSDNTDKDKIRTIVKMLRNCKMVNAPSV